MHACVQDTSGLAREAWLSLVIPTTVALHVPSVGSLVAPRYSLRSYRPAAYGAGDFGGDAQRAQACVDTYAGLVGVDSDCGAGWCVAYSGIGSWHRTIQHHLAGHKPALGSIHLCTHRLVCRYTRARSAQRTTMWGPPRGAGYAQLGEVALALGLLSVWDVE